MALAGQRFDQLILRTHHFGRPFEVVRLIDHQHIPLRIGRMRRPAFVRQQRAETTDHQLLRHKWIRFWL